MKKWEYFEHVDSSIEFMNQMGLEGWELVSVCPMGERYDDDFLHVFKRELVEVDKEEG